MSSNGHLLILVQLAACAYKSLRGDKQQLNHREKERQKAIAVEEANTGKYHETKFLPHV